ncbi:MAG: response regulator [Pseudomonadota bacterium]|nr:response regulator [Pseudomonadota bacterium]
MFSANIKVLVVDDMETMRAMLNNYLTDMGFKKIVMANDGVNAIENLKTADKTGNPFQLIICDWDMPNMNGIEFLKICQGDEKFKNIPVIFVTVEGNQKNILEAITHGVADYIVKPYTQSLLQSKLQRVLNRIQGSATKQTG